MDELFGEVISSYSRKQAIEDGALIDVTETAKEAGFTCPVALTSGAWAETVKVPKSNRIESERGRLWDVLSMLRLHIKLRRENCPDLPYRVKVGRRLVTLKGSCGPGDGGELVMTIMLPGED